MSFLTLFTANAAAAHGHEFSGPSSPSRTSSTPYALQMMSPNAQLHKPPASVPTTVYEDITTPSPPPPKKLPRSKTSYHLAQPPPGSHHSFKPSRSLVVQLQKLSNFTRPLPTLDVLPASVFAPRLKRKLGKFFKNGVGMQDLVFLSSEDFGDEDEDDEESLSARHVVASVSAGFRKIDGEEGKGSKITIIRLDSGPQWEVSQTAAGGYEFVAYEDDGNMLMARWNPKGPNSRRRSYQTTNSDNNGDEDKKFQFSLVNPNSRRHPILGCLTKQTIEINDHYPLPSMASPLASPATTPPQSRSGSPVSMSPLGVAFQLSDERVMVKTSEHMRVLMLVSGIWVALREGLVTSNMRLDEPLSPTCTFSPSSSLFPNSRLSSTYVRPTITARSVSDPTAKSVFDDPTIRRPTRAATLLTHSATTNSHRHSAPPGAPETTAAPRRANSLGVSPRHRAHSTGVVRNIGRTSPVPESRANTRASTRTSTPEPPKATVRMPVPPTTPPTIGCINRRFQGHRHTNSVSLPNSPDKHREKQKQNTTNPTEELRKTEREKRRWGKRLSGLVDMLKRVTS